MHLIIVSLVHQLPHEHVHYVEKCLEGTTLMTSSWDSTSPCCWDVWDVVGLGYFIVWNVMTLEDSSMVALIFFSKSKNVMSSMTNW